MEGKLMASRLSTPHILQKPHRNNHYPEVMAILTTALHMKATDTGGG